MIFRIKKGYKCPHCRVVHKDYVQWEGASSPKCLKCNKPVPKDAVLSQYVKHRSSKKDKKRGKKKRGKDNGRAKDTAVKQEESRKERERASPFITPKTQHEILEEVLREFDCKEKFIKTIVRRSKRLEGIYPGDLRNYLLSMQSGVRTRDQAAFIADDYALALNKERAEASTRGYETAYPLERRERKKYERPFGERKTFYDDKYAEGRHPPLHKEPQRERRVRGEGVSREDVREMVEDTLERMEQKREREEVLRSMGSRINRVERDIASIPGRINEGLSKMLEKSKDAEKPKEITKADIENTALNLEKKYIKKESDRALKESREREKKFQKTIEDLSKERNELLKKSASRRATDISGYQSDSGRVIGEAVSGLKDVIETRQPMKLVVEGLPKLLYPTGFGKGENMPEMKEEKIEGGGVAQYLDPEYVEEE